MEAMTLNRNAQIKEPGATDSRAAKLKAAILSHQRRPDALIQVLHTAQNLWGYLPLGVLRFVSRELKLPPSQVYGVATFYHFFSLKPKGEHSVVICTGTACYVKGAQGILDAMEKTYGLKPGQVSKDGKLGVEQARCIGACGLAPAVIIDEEMFPKLDAEGTLKAVKTRTGV